MKKTISLLLALVMCLSLCACGKKSNTEDAQYYKDQIGELVQAYENEINSLIERIAQLEEENKQLTEEYNAEMNAIHDKGTNSQETIEPDTIEPKYEEIVLTVDNFFTYFELTSDENVNTNSFGEVESWYIDWYYAIKEEYASSYLSEKTAIKISYTEGQQVCNFDLENKTYELTDEFIANDSVTNVIRERYGMTAINLGQSTCFFKRNPPYISYYIFHDLEVTDVTGSIFVPVP